MRPEQTHGGGYVLRCERVPYRLLAGAMDLVPSTGFLVKVPLCGRVQPRTEEIREQLVVAEPMAIVVEPEEKHVGLLEAGQDGFAVGLSGDGIAQWSREPVEDGGLLQERTDLLRLLAQDFGRQVFDYIVVFAIEPRDSLGDVDALGPRVLLHR